MEKETEKKVLQETGRLITQNFGAAGSEEGFLAAVAGGREELARQLARAIGELLEQQPERLVQIMYRIDVAEPSFREALTKAAPSAELAELVIERMIQKAKSRIRYRETGEI